ncbi:MAG TPA: FMN-binding protein [Mollicutes bacterium]|nr:FMN-binding protein [Mollicutes bacterium]
MILSVFIVALVLIFITVKSIISKIESNLKGLLNVEIKEINLTQIEDGKYIGRYEVFPVAVEVEVAILDHKISKIKIIEHENGQGGSAEVIIDKVIEKQSLEVDVIAGATYSSKVILKAIEDALDR